MTTTSEQINEIINQFMNEAKEALANIITSVQSDQLLEQMRNDPNLYEQKLNYIQQIIKDSFELQPLNQKFTREIECLKQKRLQLQGKLQQSSQQYISQLGNIEIQYKQFLVEKQNEKKLMEKQIQERNQQLFSVKKDFSSKHKNLEMQCEDMKKQIQIMRSRQNNYKINIEEAGRTEQSLRQQIRKIKSYENRQNQQKTIKFCELQSQHMKLKVENNKLIQNIEDLQEKVHSYQISEEEHSETIQKMKGDMFLIKQQWQNRCIQIQRQMGEEYRAKLIEQESQMNQKLEGYIQDLKLGKNIIIQSSEQVLQSKRLLIQQKYNQQLDKFAREVQTERNKRGQAQAKLQAMIEECSAKQSQMKEMRLNYQSQIKNLTNSMHAKEQQSTLEVNSLKEQSQKQIQRLRKTEAMLLRDLKTSKSEKQQIVKEVNSIRQQFNVCKERQQKQSKRLKQFEETNGLNTAKILELKKDLALMNQKNYLSERNTKEKNTQIQRLQGNLVQIRAQYKELDAIARKLQIKSAQFSLNCKQNERIRLQNLQKVDKLYMSVRKLAKQLTLINQDISFLVNVQKNKLSTIIVALNEQFGIREENIMYRNKLKIRELLDQIQIQKRQQKQQFDLLYRENQNMKRQVKLLEQVMQEKQQDHSYNRSRVVNLEVQKCRLFMQQQVARERDEKRKVEQKIYNQQKKHEYLISKAQKQVTKNVRIFMSKWQDKFSLTQQNLQLKEKALKQTSLHLKRTLTELQTIKSNIEQTQQKLCKQQRKYQGLKQERDKTVDEMMKRLQKQTKHKLSLQRELKQIRGQIIKTQKNGTDSPFNNYSFTDRENAGVYTNAFQAATQDQLKTNIKTNHREKQLSQIRLMIAKTYKAVEGPDRESPIHKGKLF